MFSGEVRLSKPSIEMNLSMLSSNGRSWAAISRLQHTFSTLTNFSRTFSTLTRESFHDDDRHFRPSKLILFHDNSRPHNPFRKSAVVDEGAGFLANACEIRVQSTRSILRMRSDRTPFS